ncbi:MAG: hypothetical protein COT90_01455 [Candidatus Diapherotrites archaeon CG10_big_fil_rev_8_21_14_0_10_31_34]|nr:MAG: hypothetical protein COT90_01455 [Candidatus Diapherotrites archaeon CG10_big_fil_rev_8_21_14_0_10_31_34]
MIRSNFICFPIFINKYMKRILLFGTFSLFIANIVYMLSGYGVNIFLAKTLGAANYGIYAITISLVSLISILFISGSQGAISLLISQKKNNAESIKKSGIKLNLFIGVLVFIVYYLCADLIAIGLNDSSIALYIKISSIMIPIFFLYPVFLGYFNGLQKYNKQSLVTISYSITKFATIIFLVLSGFSLFGAIIGFALAPLAAIVMGAYLSEKNKAKKSFEYLKILKLAIPITVFSFLFESAFTFGLFSVKALLIENGLTGLYNAALQTSRLPYYLTMALAGALFPIISESFSNNKKNELKMHLKKSLKYFIIFILPLSIILSLFSKQILKIFFGNEFILASESLFWLAISSIFVSLFYIFCVVLIAMNKEKETALISVIVLVVSVILNFLLIPVIGIKGASIATGISFFVGSIICGINVFRIVFLKKKSEKSND